MIIKKHDWSKVQGNCIRQWIGAQRVGRWLYSQLSAGVLAKHMRKYGGHLVDDGDDFRTVDDLSFQSAAVEGDDGGGHGVSFGAIILKQKYGSNCWGRALDKAGVIKELDSSECGDAVEEHVGSLSEVTCAREVHCFVNLRQKSNANHKKTKKKTKRRQKVTCFMLWRTKTLRRLRRSQSPPTSTNSFAFSMALVIRGRSSPANAILSLLKAMSTF